MSQVGSSIEEGNFNKMLVQDKKYIQRMAPFNTYGLKPMKFNTKNGIVEITDEGWVIIETIKSRRLISISPSGLKVRINRSMFMRSSLNKILS